MVGANQSPEVTVCTKSNPMIGAVQEKLTSTSVKAIRKMLIIPVVLEALLSTAFPQLSGNLISNHPKKEKAKTAKRRKRMILNTALVLSAFKVLGPAMAVTARPRTK